MKIRSPILVALGHVDHGKTSLLDTIRGSAVAKTEPGFITQYISASYIPLNTIRSRCGPLLKRMGIELTIPGLLWIDSPGHEAFTTLRKRGGAIADLAVLVVDIQEGFQPQTRESLLFLKQFKTPFVVALTKIDRLLGWHPHPWECFSLTFPEQSARTQEEFDERFYKVVGQLGQEGFSAERHDRVEDYTKQVAIVPLSSATGEGIADLLIVLGGIAQRYLRKGLEVREGMGKGTVMEVKDFTGLGSTVDVILYDGEIHRGDYLAIGGKEPVQSRVKALLVPAPLQELRMEKSFKPVAEATAAAGVKIAGPGLEGVAAGSPLRVVRHERDLPKALQEVQQEVEEVEFTSSQEGVILKADTLGSLEALIKTLDGLVPIRRAAVGVVSKQDVMEVKSMPLPVIFAFGGRLPPEAEKLAKDNAVALFHSDIIYRMVEDFQTWKKAGSEREAEQALASLPRPARLRVLPGFLFRQKKPAVFGVEVLQGTLKQGARLQCKGQDLGEVKELQDRGESRQEAKQGDKVAISLPDAVFGKDCKEGSLLEVRLRPQEKERLLQLQDRLREDERALLQEYS